MAIITGVETEKTRIRIDLDGRFYMYMRPKDFKMYPLEEGSPIDEEAFTDRLAALQLSDAYEDALSLLDRSQKTCEEIRKKLQAKGYVPQAIEAVTERLTKAGIVNDTLYADRITESLSKKPVGKYAAMRKLRQRGFSEEDAENALSEHINEEQQRKGAAALAKKLWPRYSEKNALREAKGKLSQALVRRGFDWDTVRYAVDTVCSDAEDEYE